MANNNFQEMGRIGQNRWGGYFYEEFLPELQGRKGIQAYKEMSENDDIIGAVLFAIEMLIRQADWSVQPGGATDMDQKAADFIQSCMDDMADTWTDTLSEILSFLVYGWSVHEIVYKRRAGKSSDPKLKSKYTDGLIGWQKLPIRAQDTLWRWEYDGSDNLTGFTQLPPPTYELITIPAERLLMFRTKSHKGSPEGRSILRNAYRDWYFKKRIQEIEGIGIERDLAGFPTLTAPEGMEIWDEDDPDMIAMRTAADNIVQNIRRDSLEGLVLPSGWKLELLSTGGRRQFDTGAIIDRYDTRIAMTVLADFVLLGHQKVGSFALSSDKTELFSMAIGAYLDIICETFNSKAIPALIDLNSQTFDDITDYPQLTHGDVESPDIQALAAYIKDMTGVGILEPDSGLEDYVRRAANLPDKVDDAGEDIQAGKVEPGQEAKETEPQEPEDEEAKAQMAKAKLGRYD